MFNYVAFVPGYYMLLRRQDLDRVISDTTFKHFPPTFQVELFFLPSENQRLQQKQLREERKQDPKSTQSRAQLQSSSDRGVTPQPKRMPTTDPPSSFFHSQSQFKITSAVPSQPEFNPNTVFNCAKCSHPVTADQVTVYHGAKTWHWTCMTCSVCENPIRDDVIFNKDGEPVCVTCDKVFFKCCEACGLLIKTHVYEDVGELSWHKYVKKKNYHPFTVRLHLPTQCEGIASHVKSAASKFQIPSSFWNRQNPCVRNAL